MRDDSPQPDLEFRAIFSILTPVYNPSIRDLVDCFRSIRSQDYPHWEWCVVDDRSTDSRVWPLLRLFALRDSRVKVLRRKENGNISAATNDALALATGDYIIPVDNDDMLAVGALAAVNHTLAHNPYTDFVYSDEDKIDSTGRRFGTFQKPDWSPERLLCQNYCNHLSAIKTDLVRAVGGYRSEFDGAQDHDLLLRVAERDPKVVHIPSVLYHWRVSEGSTALDVSEKPAAVDAGRRAIQSAVERRGIRGEVVSAGSWYHRVRREPKATPRVSLVVPTRGTAGSIWGLNRSYVTNLIESLDSTTTYPDLEVVVVADVDTPDHAVPQSSSNFDLVNVSFDEPFNFSKKCNIGALHSTGDIVIFVNDDVEPRSADWVETLVAHLEAPDVGAVGPMLLFDNHLVQSAGHINPGPSQFAAGMSPLSPAAGGWPLVLNREVSGLTGACLAMRKDVFFSVGGFCELLPLNYNDVDLGFKLQMEGFRLVWTPDATLYHFESKSRETAVSDEEKEMLGRHWGRIVGAGKRDAYVG